MFEEPCYYHNIYDHLSTNKSMVNTLNDGHKNQNLKRGPLFKVSKDILQYTIENIP